MTDGGPRRPLVISTSTLPIEPNDGIARFVLDLAKSLSDRFDVTVLAPHGPGAERRQSMEGVKVVRFRYFLPARLQHLAYGGGMAANLGSDWLAKLQVPFFIIAQTFALRRVLRRTGARVVNAHWMVPQGLSASILRGIVPFKHILHVHAADVYLLRRLPFGGAIARFVVKRADWIFADGSHVKESLDALIARDSGAVLRPMGVWTDEFSTSTAITNVPFRDGYILFIGRFVEKKGVVFLLRAFKEVRADSPDLGLVLIGGGPLERVLRLEVDQLGLGDAVTFTGPMPHEAIVRYLHGCRVACVPSIIDSKGETEGMPTVVIEAMAAGVPVVGSDVDGIPDVLRHRENGWLANPADADDLARKLSEALTSVSNDSISKEARRTAELHDWQRVSEQYATAIANVERE